MATEEKVEMAARAPPKTTTSPKTSTSFSALSNKNSKEEAKGEAEGLPAPLQTETLCQTQVPTQKDSTDSVEPPDHQTMYYKGHDASTVGRYGYGGQKLCSEVR